MERGEREGKEGGNLRERDRKRQRKRECVCRGAASYWKLFVCGVTSLLLEADVSVADIAMRNFTMLDKEKRLLFHISERQRNGEACSPPVHKRQRSVHTL